MTEKSPSWHELEIINAEEENFMSTLTKEQVKEIIPSNNL
ncbi:MAG: hypothetical protein JG759_555 [Thermoanaerobacter sp.]|jgi:hypothetical protein|nr:hypothetical protein [Thermoanaerobacter sp.]